MAGKALRWLAVFDNHGDMADCNAIAAMFEFKREFKPDLTIHGGDCFDLRCLRKGASKDEEFEELAPDIDAGCDFLKRLAPDVFLRGNHDERLWDAVKSANPVVSRFASMCIANEITPAVGKAKMLRYDKRDGIFRVGHMKFAHGYAAGINAARTMANAFGSVVFGHVHYIDSVSIACLDPRVGRAAGCLCQLDMTYNRAQIQTLRQQHGFAYGFIYPDGRYTYYQAEAFAGEWFLPTEFKRIKARAA